jgi:hypothetical protein
MEKSKSPPSRTEPGKDGAPRKRLCVMGTAFAVPKGTKRNLSPRAAPEGQKGANTLQFKIKDQDYFLAFVEQEKRWYVFAPTSEGVNRIPVYVDAAKYERPGILETETSLSS